MLKFYQLQWKEKFRSEIWQKSAAINILFALLILYLVSNVMIISYFANKLLLRVLPDENPVDIFTGLILGYFLLELLLRFWFQKMPYLSIKPFLYLPVLKRKLLHFSLIQSLFTFFNLSSLALILPFYFKNICFAEETWFSISWLVLMLSMIIINHYMALIMKIQFRKKPLRVFIIAIIFFFFLYYDLIHYGLVRNSLIKLLEISSQNLFWFIFPIMVILGLYRLAFVILDNHGYVEENIGNKARKIAKLSLFSDTKEMGRMLNLEIKLIIRNKRPRSLMINSIFYVAYGLLIYRSKEILDIPLYTLAAIFLTMFLNINYSQFLLSWESCYYDFNLTRKMTVFKYLKNRYLIFTFLSILSYVLTLPYMFMIPAIGLINGAFLLYVLGVGSYIILFLNLFSTSFVDLGKGQFMNFRGLGATQMFMFLPVFIVPFLIYGLLYLFSVSEWYFYVLAIVGICGIACNNYILGYIEKKFTILKYHMAEGFRKRDQLN